MILYPQSVVFMIAVFYKQFVKSFLSFFKTNWKSTRLCFKASFQTDVPKITVFCHNPENTFPLI